MNAEEFLPLFIEALYRVHQNYYRHELWRDLEWQQVLEGFEGSGNQNNIQELKEYLDRYGERVFCYELYHQTRKIMEDRVFDIREPDEDGVTFQAELRKDTLHKVKHFFPNFIQGLEKAYIPDFLLHAPGNFDHQELIIEVKSNPQLLLSDMQKDLQKIHQFIDRYKYRAGLFLSVNTHPDYINELLQILRDNSWLMDNLTQRGKILVICKPSQREAHAEWHLSGL